MEKLPPIPSEPGTPQPNSSTNGALPNVTGWGNSSTLPSTNVPSTNTAQTSPSGLLSSNPTGLPNFGSNPGVGNGNATASSTNFSSLGVGLRPQPTGGALRGANPFRASMALAGGTGGTGFSDLSAFRNVPVSGFPPAFGSSVPNSGALNSTTTGAPQLHSSFPGLEFSSQFNNLSIGGGLAQSNPGGAPPNHQHQSLI